MEENQTVVLTQIDFEILDESKRTRERFSQNWQMKFRLRETKRKIEQMSNYL